MENQKEIAMLEDIRETIADVFVNENWRNLELEKIDFYRKQSEDCKMLKILKRLRDLIEVYQLTKARELINKEIVCLISSYYHYDHKQQRQYYICITFFDFS